MALNSSGVIHDPYSGPMGSLTAASFSSTPSLAPARATWNDTASVPRALSSLTQPAGTATRVKRTARSVTVAVACGGGTREIAADGDGVARSNAMAKVRAAGIRGRRSRCGDPILRHACNLINEAFVQLIWRLGYILNSAAKKWKKQ